MGVLTGGRLTAEDAYAYSKFARVALGSNDIDFRARPHSAEEAGFLAAHVVATSLEVTYADLEKAKVVVLAGFEPEDESPIVFLRLRKAARANRTKVVSIAPFTSRGLDKMHGTLVRTAPGGEAEALRALANDGPVTLGDDAVILVGCSRELDDSVTVFRQRGILDDQEVLRIFLSRVREIVAPCYHRIVADEHFVVHEIVPAARRVRRPRPGRRASA